METFTIVCVVYVCVCVGSHRQHALYIWDKATGSLVKMLTGHKGETLLDIVVSICVMLLMHEYKIHVCVLLLTRT